MNSFLKSLFWSVRLTCLLVFLAGMAGCQTYDPPGALIPPSPTNRVGQAGESSDLIREGDVLIIGFTGLQEALPKHEDRVNEDGFITLPFIGKVKAAGLTRTELQDAITKKYVPAYFHHLTVTVNSDVRYFYVYGEVKRPSYYGYPGSMTVLRAIAAAGDVTDFGNKKKVQLIRSTGEKPIVVNCIKAQKDPKLDLPVYPEDKIYVPRRWF